MATNIDNIVDYYINLLIIQYNDKPRARAMVETCVRQMLANGISLDVLNGYNLDTAVGVQLDVLAKYVGVDRFFTRQTFAGYFSFYQYSDDAYIYDDSGKIGFSTYDDFDTKVGKWLIYQNITSQLITLTDEEFRTIIKLKIIQNNSNFSHKSIDDSIFAFFGTDLIPTSIGNMQITYIATQTISTLIEVAAQKHLLPKPMGVELILLTSDIGVLVTTDSGEYVITDDGDYVITG